MSAQSVFIPKQKNIVATTEDFHWSLGSEPIYADSAAAYYSKFEVTGEESWVFSASIGSDEEENYFGFLLGVPYLDQDLMEYTYKLGADDRFYVSHSHWIPAPPGFSGVRVVKADNAELTIRLNRAKRTVTGDFIATFKSEGYRLAPSGHFELTLLHP
jgi:hypothetical protein